MSPQNPSPVIPKDAHIAILLNGNARRVKPYLIDRLSRYIPRQDIYFSKSHRASGADLPKRSIIRNMIWCLQQVEMEPSFIV